MTITSAQAWDVLRRVPDPEIPVISVTELGIVRDVQVADEGGAARVDVVVTPTYAGCPATEAIARSIREALGAAGAAQVRISTQLAPAWTTDWIAPAALDKLRDYGIAPPHRTARAEPGVRNEHPLRFVAPTPRPACPHCGGADTERLSQFGATACKALYRCCDCREPFEYFKPL